MVVLLAFMLAQPATDFDAFFEEFAQKRDAIGSVQADFEQIVETPDETYTKTGQIAYKDPRQLAFRYDDPAQTLIMIDRTIYDYDVEVRQLNVQEVEDLKEAEALFLAFENNPDRLRELYDITVENNPDTSRAECASRAIILEPKAAEAEAPGMFERSVLYLREQDFLPCMIHVESQDTISYFYIRNYRINETMDQGALSIVLPEGVSVVYNDILVDVTTEDDVEVPAELSAADLASRVDADLKGSEAVVYDPSALERGTDRP
jgi:outer membrane lipoprotein-sorting protein